MRELTWRWTLPSGDAVKATLDRHRDIESVWLGRRLASRSRIGQRPQGHIVELTRARAGPYRSGGAVGPCHEVHVVFDRQDDPVPPTCALWVGILPLVPEVAPGSASARMGAPLAALAVVIGALLAAMGWAL